MPFNLAAIRRQHQGVGRIKSEKELKILCLGHLIIGGLQPDQSGIIVFVAVGPGGRCTKYQSRKNHANGAKNPLAHLRKEITIEKALSARMISEPLGLYDCSLISDGAAAILLCSSGRARAFSGKTVTVRGIAQASDHVALDEKDVITTFPAVKAASQKAYKMAGMSPKDVDFAELHDCFTIAEIVALEDLGFVPRGQGGPATAAGFTSANGEKPVNTSGGLKSKGHLVGATGVAQIREIVEQIRGNCVERQLKKTNIGLTQNLGGSGATCVVGIFSA